MVLEIDVREAILDAAEELLGRFGFRKMTVEDIAREAEIGKGTIYLHFKSKEDVALSTIDRIVSEVLVRLEEIESSERDPGRALRAMLTARVMIRFDRARGHRESLNEMLAVIRAALLERRKAWFRKEAAVLERVVAAGLEQGEFRAVDPREAARDFVAATNAFLPYSLSPREMGRRSDLEGRVGRIGELLVRGLRAAAN